MKFFQLNFGDVICFSCRTLLSASSLWGGLKKIFRKLLLKLYLKQIMLRFSKIDEIIYDATIKKSSKCVSRKRVWNSFSFILPSFGQNCYDDKTWRRPCQKIEKIYFPGCIPMVRQVRNFEGLKIFNLESVRSKQSELTVAPRVVGFGLS